MVFSLSLRHLMKDVLLNDKLMTALSCQYNNVFAKHMAHHELSTTKRMENKSYQPAELKQLYGVLYEILVEIDRVCRLLDTPFFMIGGSAIGVHFWGEIVPFDDDIDIGMKRDDYERFIKEAPKLLNSSYFLQCFATEPHTPYYFAKVRKNNTLYVEETVKNIPMHQGIFIDVIPFDHIPDSPKAERRQRKLANLIDVCFQAKEVWLWRYFGHCEIEHPLRQTFLNCLVTRLVATFIPKRLIYALLHKILTYYNKKHVTYYNNVMISADHIPVVDLENLVKRPFGPLQVNVPSNLESYLKYHYPTLKKYMTEEEIARYSHAPQVLKF